jgi:formylglycine-generating enzyme required for sulfatase activity
MIQVGASRASIGLDPREVTAVYKKYRGMGLEKEWLIKEVPCHVVALETYSIAKYPVTNKEYRQFLLETRFPEIPSSWKFGGFPQSKSNHPVYSVSLKAARAYCKWLSKKTKRNFRLPTETEWEYAASGPQRLEFPWGNHFNKTKTNTRELDLRDTTAVGVFPKGASWIGALDMGGNVEELVEDMYRVYPGGIIVNDDLYQANPDYPMTRGGSFTRYADLARTKRRHGLFKNELYPIGFRLAEV